MSSFFDTISLSSGHAFRIMMKDLSPVLISLGRFFFALGWLSAIYAAWSVDGCPLPEMINWVRNAPALTNHTNSALKRALWTISVNNKRKPGHIFSPDSCG